MTNPILQRAIDLGIIEPNGNSFKLSKKLIESCHGFMSICMTFLMENSVIEPEHLILLRSQRTKEQKIQELHQLLLVWVQVEHNMTPTIEVYNEMKDIANELYRFVAEQLEF